MLQQSWPRCNWHKEIAWSDEEIFERPPFRGKKRKDRRKNVQKKQGIIYKQTNMRYVNIWPRACMHINEDVRHVTSLLSAVKLSIGRRVSRTCVRRVRHRSICPNRNSKQISWQTIEQKENVESIAFCERDSAGWNWGRRNKSIRSTTNLSWSSTSSWINGQCLVSTVKVKDI